MEIAPILMEIEGELRKRGCCAYYRSHKGYNMVFLITDNEYNCIEHGWYIMLDDSGNFKLGPNKIEFKYDEDPIDKFVRFYDSICDRISKNERPSFIMALFMVLCNVLLWAFVFVDNHWLSIIFWVMPIMIYAYYNCRVYFGTSIYRIGGKCLTWFLS